MPGVYFGPYGTQYKTYGTPTGSHCGRFPLGHRLILPDGREYRFALAGADVRVAGHLYQMEVPAANHDELVVTVIPAVGDKTFAATLGATAAAVDEYSEGMVHVNKSTGLDTGYRIRRDRTPMDFSGR